MDAAELPAARFAWFSPGCGHHSPANSKKIYQRGRQATFFEEHDFDEVTYANSERSRVTMHCQSIVPLSSSLYCCRFFCPLPLNHDDNHRMMSHLLLRLARIAAQARCFTLT